MWYGKVSIICYLFSLGIIFMTFYLNTNIFHDASITNGFTYNQLQALTNSTYSFNQPNLQVDVALIFGDFYHVFLFVLGLMSGNIFSTAFGSTGIMVQSGFAYDGLLSLFTALVFDSATVFLILYIVSNRSL